MLTPQTECFQVSYLDSALPRFDTISRNFFIKTLETLKLRSGLAGRVPYCSNNEKRRNNQKCCDTPMILLHKIQHCTHFRQSFTSTKSLLTMFIGVLGFCPISEPVHLILVIVSADSTCRLGTPGLQESEDPNRNSKTRVKISETCVRILLRAKAGFSLIVLQAGTARICRSLIYQYQSALLSHVSAVS